MTAKRLPWLWIIGIGDDGLRGVTRDAQQLIAAADTLVGGARHLEFVPTRPDQQRLAWPKPWSAMAENLRAERDAGKTVCVLVSGDPFWYSGGSHVAAHFGRHEWVCIPRISAFQLAAQRIGWPLQACQTISLHGRAVSSVLNCLGKGGKVLALAEAETAAAVSDLLSEKGFEGVEITCLEHLGGTQERVYTFSPHLSPSGTGGHTTGLVTAGLVTLAFDLGESRTLAPLAGLPDCAFEHDGQMTKQEVRAITLARLAPKPGELLWDLGAGSGSIAIEWCRLQPDARAVAVERNPARVQRIQRNANKLAAYRLQTLQQSVDDPIEGDPPDAVFIGGGLNAGLLQACWAVIPPGGRLAANAVTLESEALLTGFPASLGLDPTGHLLRISGERPIRVGDKFGWKPAMTVTQLVMTKP